MFNFIHGKIRPDSLVAYCVIYNEMYYLPAFLKHYRALGIEQFVFIDDCSTDESESFLKSQNDTVIVRADMRYGDKLNGKRAGPQWKTILAQQYLLGRWALCVDADEFLVFHSRSLPDLILQAEAEGHRALGAVMVDMYPANSEKLTKPDFPNSFTDMLQSYCCFDKGPYIVWQRGALRPRVVNEGAGKRLLRQQGIKSSDYSSFVVRVREYFGKKRARSIFKVPLVKWDTGFQYLDAHTLNHPPSTIDGLVLLHFKYTSALREKITWAKERKSLSKGSRGYFAMDAMLSSADTMRNGLTYEGTCQYASYGDLEAARIVPFCAP